MRKKTEGRRRDRGREKARSQAPETDGGWELATRALGLGCVRTALLWGPPGTGKTWAALREGDTTRGVYALTLTEETPASELRGNYMPRGETLVWTDGPAARAMREGARLVLNEITLASPDVLSLLYGVLESPETARLTLPNNETLRPAPGFAVVATDNAPPDELPEALQDRFDVRIRIREPHPEALEGLSPEIREAARRSFGVEEERRVSLRAWHMLDRLRGEVGLRDACLLVFGTERGAQIHDALHLGGLR